MEPARRTVKQRRQRVRSERVFGDTFFSHQNFIQFCTESPLRTASQPSASPPDCLATPPGCLQAAAARLQLAAAPVQCQCDLAAATSYWRAPAGRPPDLTGPGSGRPPAGHRQGRSESISDSSIHESSIDSLRIQCDFLMKSFSEYMCPELHIYWSEKVLVQF